MGVNVSGEPFAERYQGRMFRAGALTEGLDGRLDRLEVSHHARSGGVRLFRCAMRDMRGQTRALLHFVQEARRLDGSNSR